MNTTIKTIIMSALITIGVMGPASYVQYEKNKELLDIIELQQRAINRHNEAMINLATAIYYVSGAVQGIDSRVVELEKR